MTAIFVVTCLFASVPAQAQEHLDPPDPPQNVRVTVGDAKLTLTWQAPSAWGSGTALGYQVDWYSGAEAPAHTSAEWQVVEYNRRTDASPTETSFTFSGNVNGRVHNGMNWVRGYHTVANGNQYHLRLRAVSTKPGDPTDLLVSNWVTVGGMAEATLSTNADLSALTAGSATSSGGPYTDFSIGTFAALTTSYTASVANAQTHVKLTPTVADTGKATVGVRKGNTGNFTPVTSGSASGAIALDVGSNAITVRVTAEDTTTTKDYTVTITRRAAQSTNANLSGLTASSATSSGGPFNSLTLTPSSFPAARTSYTASVANAQTHVKLTPTVADTGKATVTVDGTAVDSGTASDAIALSVGSNAITVRVTAEDTTTTKDYTVTITRRAAQSTNANLSGLTASSATSSGGPFNSLTLTPSSFSAARTSYTASVANAQTHVKLTPTVADTGKATVTVDGTAVDSGTASDAIALSVGSNAITVRVTAEDTTTTKDYTVTITRAAAQVSNVPTGLTLTAGDGELQAAWTAPTGVDVARYEVQIKLKSAANWPNTDTDVTGTNHTFTGLTNDSTYQVRVRTVETGEQTPSDWTTPAEGTPRAQAADPTVTLSASPNPVTEGSSVTVTARLSAAASSQVTIPVTVSTSGSNTAELGDVNGTTSINISISSGQTTGTGTITTAQDADTNDETFTVALGTLPSGVTAGSPSLLRIRITDDDSGGGGGGGGSGGGGGAPPTGGDSPSPDDCGDNDRENLVSFYDAADGDNWNNNTNWKSEEPLDQWHGVDTDEDGEVLSLRLADNNLSGDMPTEELLCLNEDTDTELKELALWDNEGLSGEVPDELMRAVERAVLRDVAEAEALNLNPGWFDDYEDPFNFSDWHSGVTTDEDGRVTELDFTGEGITGEIPQSVFELERLTAINTGCRVTVDPVPERVRVTMPEGCSDASLENIEISPGELEFDPMDLSYEVPVGYGPENVTVTPTASESEAVITVNGNTVQSGEDVEIGLNEEEPSIVSIVVTAPDGMTTRTYGITVTRCGEDDIWALSRFYEAVGGQNWNDNTNWNSKEPLDRWFGVGTDEEKRVISLDLEDNGLSGETPRELVCLSEIKELALWDNEGLSREVPEELALAVERAVLRDVAEALSLNAQWFDDYEEPFDFESWHLGVTTDDDERVTELDFTGEDITGVIPGSVFELKRLTAIETGCEVTLEIEAPGRVSVMMADDCVDETVSSGGGGCALGQGNSSVSGFGLFLVTLLVFAALGRRRAHSS